MKITFQSAIWFFLCFIIAVGGVPLLIGLMVGTGAIFIFVRRYCMPIDALIFLFLLFSAFSLFRGNPPIGILVVLLSVMFAAQFSKIIEKNSIPGFVLCGCMLAGSFPLNDGGWRYSGIFENPNTFASFVCTNMALFFILGCRASLKVACVFLVCFICVLLSGSRSWSVIAAFFTLVIFANAFKVMEKSMFIKPFVVCCCLYFIYIVPWVQVFTTHLNVFVSRFGALSKGGDGSTTERLRNLEIAIKSMMDKPVFGEGVSGFYILSGDRYHSHSTILELLVSFGLIIGSFLVLGLFFVTTQLVFKPGHYGMSRLESIGISGYLLLFLFFDSILSNVLALTALFSLLALSPRWRGFVNRSLLAHQRLKPES